MNKKLTAKALQARSGLSGSSEIQKRSGNLWAGVLLAVFATSASSFADQTNLLVNGDFEEPALQCGLWLPVPEGSGYITGWNVCSDSTNNINGGCNSFPGYSRSVDMIVDSTGFYVHSGHQSIDMAGTMGTAGDSLFQDVPTKTGRTYTLTLYTSSNGWQMENSLTIEWNDVPIATISTPQPGQWSVNTFSIVASSDVSRLRFVDNVGGGQGCLLDTVSLVEDEVSDQEPPVVSCLPSITVPVGGVPPAATNVTDFKAQGGSISDNQDPNPSVVSTDEVSGSCPTQLTRTYTVTDAAGNATQCQQLIAVQNRLEGILWFPPVARLCRTNEFIFKYGRTIPVKIRPQGCDEANLTHNTNIVATLQVLALSDCQDSSTAQPVAIGNDGATAVLMEKCGGHLKYNLNTKKLPTNTPCFLLQANIVDVSTGETLSETLPIHSRSR